MKILKSILLSVAMVLALAVPAQAGGVNASTRTYGWSWQQPIVYVYDATPSTSAWKVSEAVAEWNKPNDRLNLVLTTDQSIADIQVFEEPAPDVYSGYARWTESGGVVTDCRVSLSPYWANDYKAETTAVHELGHCVGLDHNSTFIKGSVMNSTVSNSTAVFKPGAVDYKSLSTLY
jgi:predicted Zn-dependent protease